MLQKITPPIAILGFGVEGQAAFDYLKKQGYSDITICDQNPDPPKRSDQAMGVKWKLGSHAFDDLTKFKTIFRSPGVKYDLPSIQQARDQGITVTSITELTLEAAKERITAITGSNGKTTTTQLTASILRQHYGGRLIAGGNDGVPVLQEAVDRPADPILLEVSSFQFADLSTSPRIAAILNISPNHLDWHENLEDYIHAKSNVIQHQKADDWAILNAANENCAKLAHRAPAQIFWLNQKKGEHWAVWEEDELKVCLRGKTRIILSKTDITLKTHPDNILCAVALGHLHGVSNDNILKGIQSFKGAAQRLEYLGEKNGIKFYNDSACTTPESAQVAIHQFEPGTLVMLLGGSSKKSEFDYLADDIIKNKVRVVLYGQEGPVIQASLEAKGGKDLILFLDSAKDFRQIVQKAFSLCKSGDSLVLSPACASFDMFKNSKERGYQFKEIIEEVMSKD